jgi:predicted Zn-dependent protease
MRLIVSVVTLLLLFVAGCVQTAGGRSLVNVLSPEQEAAMGANAYQEILSTATVLASGPAVDRVREVGKRIAAVTGKDYQWEFTVIDDPKTVNAFCLPGGKVAVYTGLLNLATTDDELAVVMGHEIAHATCRHGGARVTRNVIQGLGLEVAQLLVKTGNETADNLVMAALGAGTTVGISLPYSREDEREADRVGLTYMFEAGYDPDAAAAFWEKMAAAGGEGPPEWLSTHPNPENRMETLRRLAAELKQKNQ